MKPDLKREWVKALRSGEYRQTTRRLHDDNGFCCLGVLADIAVDGYWARDEDVGDWILVDEGNGERMSEGLIDLNVASKIGVKKYQEKLANLNDLNQLTFPQIADWIEENIPEEKGEKMDSDTRKWAVENRETGRVAYTRESGYNSRAFFTTREQARQALREGRVYVDPSRGRVAKVAN